MRNLDSHIRQIVNIAVDDAPEPDPFPEMKSTSSRARILVPAVAILAVAVTSVLILRDEAQIPSVNTIAAESTTATPTSPIPAAGPIAGSSTTAGSTTTLPASASLRVPDVVGTDAYDAAGLLRDLGFDTLLVYGSDPDGPSDVVASTDPAAGSSMAPGSLVRLIVSGLGYEPDDDPRQNALAALQVEISSHPLAYIGSYLLDDGSLGVAIASVADVAAAEERLREVANGDVGVVTNVCDTTRAELDAIRDVLKGWQWSSSPGTLVFLPLDPENCRVLIRVSTPPETDVEAITDLYGDLVHFEGT